MGDTFHYNAVLRVIAHQMQVMINQVKKEVRKVCKDSIITFVKGEQCKTSSKNYNKSGILHSQKLFVYQNKDQILKLRKVI